MHGSATPGRESPTLVRGCEVRALPAEDEPSFDEIRQFIDRDADVLPRLEALLATIGERVRGRATDGLDTTAIWSEIERRLWGPDDGAPQSS
jgi:hypothetical protein